MDVFKTVTRGLSRSGRSAASGGGLIFPDGHANDWGHQCHGPCRKAAGLGRDFASGRTDRLLIDRMQVLVKFEVFQSVLPGGCFGDEILTLDNDTYLRVLDPKNPEHRAFSAVHLPIRL